MAGPRRGSLSPQARTSVVDHREWRAASWLPRVGRDQPCLGRRRNEQSAADRAVGDPSAVKQSKGFEIIYGAVQRHGSLDVDLPASPNFFLYADPGKSVGSLTAAGFGGASSMIVPQTWQLPTAHDLFESILNGTVRAAALLKRQSREAVEHIRHSVRQAMEAYADGGVYRVPMPAALVATRKPAES